MKKTLLIYVTMTVIFYVFYRAKANAYEVLAKNQLYSIKIKLKKEGDYLNKNLGFVGKTKSYTFLYDFENENSIIYPNDTVESYLISK